MRMRSFSKCNQQFDSKNTTCKDVAITKELIEEGRNIPNGLGPHHTVNIKANSGCNFEVSYEGTAQTYGGFNFLFN